MDKSTRRQSDATSVLANEPREVNLVDLVRERASEISDLLSVINACDPSVGKDQSAKAKTYVQRLPRHLRRRAMTHNLRRVPRRLRHFAQPSLENSKHQKKPPSRRWRRRPSNLLQDYIRRQRKGATWLETHIWHAKRFHIRELWNYKIPFAATARGFRPAYRDMAKHCVAIDISYHHVIQLHGSYSELCERVKVLVSPETGITFAARSAQRGNAMQTVTVYQPSAYPFDVIGPVEFLWQTVDESSDLASTNEGQRTLLLFCHPSISEELMSALKQCLNLQPNVEMSETSETLCERIKNVAQYYSMKAKSASCFTNAVAGICVTSLKDEFARFRLIGPKSTEILCSAIHPVSSDIIAKFLTAESNSSEESSSQWWRKFYANADRRRLLAAAHSMFEALRSAGDSRSCLPPSGFVLPLLLRDSRLFLTHSKQPPASRQVYRRTNDSQLLANLNGDQPCSFPSPIWSAEIRELVRSRQLSESALNKQRQSSFGLNTVSLREIGEDEMLIPALLIHRQGSTAKHLIGFGSGWDILVPSGCGRPVWLSLQYKTARAGGLRETRGAALQIGQQPCFPEDWPDCRAGDEMQKCVEEELRQKSEKRPPNKRLNYERLKIAYPFSFPWQRLVCEWRSQVKPVAVSNATADSKCFVVRNRKLLSCLAAAFKAKRNTALPEVDPSFAFLLDPKNEQLQNSLVPVKIIAVAKGVPRARAILCIPHADDISKLRCPKSIAKLLDRKKDACKVFEELCPETEHRMPDKGAKRVPLKACDMQTENEWKLGDDFLSFSASSTSKSSIEMTTSVEETVRTEEEEIDLEDLFVDQKEEKRKVAKQRAKEKVKLRRAKKRQSGSNGALPAASVETTNEDGDSRSLVNSCSRKIAGAVTNGDFCFSSGKGIGVGFISILGLAELYRVNSAKPLSRPSNFLLFRNTNSRYYRLAKFEVTV